MEDDRIIDLYWARSEDAITETSKNTENTATPSLTTFFPTRRTRTRA